MPAGPTNPSPENSPGVGVTSDKALAGSNKTRGAVSIEARARQASTVGGLSEIDDLLRQAEDALATIDGSVENLPPGAHPLELQDFAALAPHGDLDVVDAPAAGEVELTIELGRARLRVEDVLKLRKGSVAPLEPLVGAPVDVYSENRLVARGDVLVLDGRFCVRVTETFHDETPG